VTPYDAGHGAIVGQT